MKKILVFRNDRLGEFLLIIPALRALKETFSAFISVVVNPYLKELAKCIPQIDEVFIWEMRKHRLTEIIFFAKELRKRKFDTALIMNPTKEAHLISYLGGIPIRVGYDRKWGFLLNKKIPDKKDSGLKHEVEYNLELVRLIGAKTQDKSLKINIPSQKISQAKRILESEGISDNYVVIHPFSSHPPKQWPLENFIELVKLISQEHNVVIVGGKENILWAEEFSRLESKKKIVNLIGKTDLLELAAILSQATCLISNDSGPVHLGCCVGVKCLVLFSNAHPSRSSLRWRPWGEGHIVIEKPQINQIEVKEVFGAFKSLI